MGYKLKVLSVVNHTFSLLDKTHATSSIFAHFGYDRELYVDPLWFGWPSKLIAIVRMVKELDESYTHVMVADGADVIVLADPDTVMERWAEFGHPWVFNAEPFIWSPGSFTPEQYPTPQCTYRYLNAGVSIGERAHVREWFGRWTNDFTQDPQCINGDQDWYAERLIKHYPDAMVLDHQCALFQTGCGSRVGPEPYLLLSQGKAHNRHTGTYPLILHANGGDDITAPDWRVTWDHLVKQRLG